MAAVRGKDRPRYDRLLYWHKLRMARLETILLFVVFLLAFLDSLGIRVVYSQPSFYFDSSTNGSAPGLQRDSTGQTFVAVGRRLYRLSPELIERESIYLSADVVDRGLSLSTHGSQVVVCLTDLSCSVFNAHNLSAGSLRTVSNALASTEFEIALFSAGESFYTGSVTGTLAQDRMVLQQYGERFARSSDNNPPEQGYKYTSPFSRHFYSGFEKNGFAYYFVSDYDPLIGHSFRLLRVCHMSDCGGVGNCGVNALYEASFGCGETVGSNRTRFCGVSVVNDFGGMIGTFAIFSRCDGLSAEDYICFVNITAADEAMDSKYDRCTGDGPADETIDIAWKDDFLCNNTFMVSAIVLIL